MEKFGRSKANVTIVLCWLDHRFFYFIWLGRI